MKIKKLSAILLISALSWFCILPADCSQDGLFYGSGPTDKKEAALTFDDGPGARTEKILVVLKKYNVRATFFIEASQIDIRPALAKKVLDAGQDIGTHTYSHPNFWVYKKDDKADVLRRELEKAEKTMAKVLNLKPELLRMPYGFVRPWVREVAKEKNYKIISWTFGCDWKKLTREELVSQYLKHLSPGAIFLMHDGGGKNKKTAEALPEIIEGIQKRGYKIVTVGEMFGFEKQNK